MEPSTLTAGSASSEVPHPARIYNYSIGGKYYYPADQAAAEYIFSFMPSTPKWVKMLRAFLQQAARQLWDAGFTHFVDFASGLPTDDHIHHVLPHAKVIYSDRDAYTCAEAQKLVGHLPNVLYLQHDIRNARSLLDSAQVRDFMGDERQLAIGLNGITVFLEPDEIIRLFHELYDWAAPGSRIFITYETKLPEMTSPGLEGFVDVFHQSGEIFRFYALEDLLAWSQPWHVPENGLMRIQDFLGLPEDYVTEEDHEGIGLEFYAAILEK